MRTLLNVFITVLILTVCNTLIWQKNAVFKNGKLMLLRLAPRDPRSLMQGDYMALNYEVSNRLRTFQIVGRSTAVMHLDQQGVATFVRLHSNEPLALGEALLQFRSGQNGIRLGGESFFFQEGTGSTYETAKYGAIRVSDSGECLLTGLRDESLRPLGSK